MIEDLPNGVSEPILIGFVFGSSPIIYTHSSVSAEDLIVQVDNAFKSHSSDTVVLGVRMHVISNLIGLVGSKIPGMKSRSGCIGAIYRTLSRNGLRVAGEVACLPSMDNARFLFPIRDHSSHLMLLRTFLLPRRYSLGFWERVLLRTYILIISILRSPRYLYQGMYLQVRKC